ncbi:metalloregulator ArsR/SmtB family transcription factor [Subtercola sp. PAMC28395]|uniref:ArsR/SmtB family transcription factor n=1 Tax=Subtercola sp. PAMC28395 TaxID=2846775 RepID=UPI001C0C63F4|nr:metalloregulator ArsR/SmtB family transcription factor [Subtercola sp. PAMC28395]QWT24586.1 metalloregulator ArsR/SmtB family transcription factor [Subtercola sp. PAMC28395]
MNENTASEPVDPEIGDTFRALADATRRRLLDTLNNRDGQTLNELCSGLAMTRQSVSKHLAILEEANLVRAVRHGREKLHYLNAAPIAAIADRWIKPYDRRRVNALADLKTALENPDMSKPTFVYTTYIHTTPEKLWNALIDPAFTSTYWGASFTTDWKVGSEMTWHYGEVTIQDAGQVVLEFDPFTRLAYSWQSIPEDFAQLVGFSPEYAEALRGEPRSQVSFELEEAGDQVKLTLVHEGFEEGSSMLGSISGGWPMVVSALKTLLETGSTTTAFGTRGGDN